MLKELIDKLNETTHSFVKNESHKPSSDNYQVCRKMALVLYQNEFDQLKSQSQFLDNEVVFCPKCHHQFEKKPLRKTKCKSCGETVYKRQWPYPESEDAKKDIITTDEGLAIIDQMYVGFPNIVGSDLVWQWFCDWKKETESKYDDSKYAQFEPWKWYQYMHNKLIPAYVKCETDIYDIENVMVNYCLSNKRFYSQAVPHIYEALVFTWDFYQHDPASFYNDELIMPGLVYLYLDIEGKLGKKKTKDRFDQCIATSGKLTPKSRIVREFIRETNKMRTDS